MLIGGLHKEDAAMGVMRVFFYDTHADDERALTFV